MRSNQSSGTSLQKETKIVASVQLAIGIIFLIGALLTFGYGLFVLTSLTTKRTDLTFQIKQDGIWNYFDNLEDPSFTPTQILADLESLKTQESIIRIDVLKIKINGLKITTDGLKSMLFSSLLFILSLFWIKLAGVLVEGAVNRHWQGCLIWLGVKFIVWMTALSVNLMMAGWSWGFFAFMLLEFYFMLIVLDFIVELHKEKREQLRSVGDRGC